MKILLVRLSSFGDVVFTLPLAKALRGEGDRLAWAVEGPLAELVEGASYVDDVLVATTRAWRKNPFSAGTRAELRTFLSALRAFEPDVVVDAQGLLKSAWITFAARARRKVGFGFRTATEKANALVARERVDVPAGTHVVDRGLALAEHVLGRTGFRGLPTSSHLVARPAPEVDDWVAVRSARPFAILQPFSSRGTKEWDAGETAAFCRALAARGIDPVLRWGPGEQARAARIVAASGGTALLAPPSPPAASARLASRAVLFVGADTGPTHLAAAAGTPTVALYGPTDPARFGPVGPRVRVLRDRTGAYNAGTAGLPARLLMLSSKPPSRSSTSGRTPRQGRRAAAALLALVLAGPLAASVAANVLPNLGREELPKDKIAPVPFGVGETLVYTISWLKIEGGEMTLATSRETSPDGVPVHRISLAAVSNDYVSRFYPVDTHYETWVDARDFSPVRFEKRAREGRYSSDEVEEFDLSRRVAVWRNAKEIRGTGPIPERFQDVISSFYFMRTVPLVPGEETRVDLYSRGKIYRLVVAVLGREKVETEFGVFDALKVQPRMHDSASASSVDRNKGKLFLWFSDDARRLPVMARTILPIGSVTARLTRVNGESPAPPQPPPVPAPAPR